VGLAPTSLTDLRAVSLLKSIWDSDIAAQVGLMKKLCNKYLDIQNQSKKTQPTNHRAIVPPSTHAR
jgi:hypothetical protein